MTNKDGHLSWKTRFAYGGGDAACNITLGMVMTIITLFYTDYMGMNLAAVSMIMLISKFVDGIVTLSMGFIVEKTRSKFGKYRPWILWSCVPYSLSIILMFLVPDTSEIGKLIYVFVTYNLCNSILYNTLNVPFGSLTYAMTRDPGERDLLCTVRMVLASTGKISAVCLSLPLVNFWGGDQAAWIKVAILMAVIALLLQLNCFKECKENAANQNQTAAAVSFKKAIKTLCANKYFWACAVINMMQCGLFTITGTVLTYYSKYIFGNDSGLYSVLYLVENICMILCMILCSGLVRKFGKRNLCIAGLAFCILGHLLCMMWPESLTMVTLSCVIRGVGFAPLGAMMYSFVGEAVEYGDWKYGIRQEGLIYASCIVFLKIGSGIAAAVVTGLLAVSGYITSSSASVVEQPASALHMIEQIYRIAPVILLGICLVILVFYQLEKQMPRISRALAERDGKLS